MEHQDWTPVVLRPKTSTATQQQSAGQLQKSRQTHQQAMQAKLAKDTESAGSPEKVPLHLSRQIQDARLAKKMTQKELAMVICEKDDVVRSYESGKAIPSPAIITKLQRALGVKFQR